MPTLFGSEYLLPAIIVVVLLLTLLMLMSSRRRAAAGAAPVKEKSRRRKKASLEAEPEVLAEAEPEVLAEAEPEVLAEAEPAVLAEAEPMMSSVAADMPAQAELAAVEPVTVRTEDIPVAEAALAAIMAAEASEDAVSADPVEVEAVEDPSQTTPSDQRRRSSRRGARMMVRTQAASSAVSRPDPLNLALVDILAGWGDLSAEDTKRLELFRAEKVVEAIAAMELPRSKSGDYARTRLTQLRQYSADLERRSRPLQVVSPESEFAMPLSAGAAATKAPGVEAAGAALIAPIVAASVVTTPVFTTPVAAAPLEKGMSLKGDTYGGGTILPFAPVPAGDATEAGDQVAATAANATIVDFYGSPIDTVMEEPAAEAPAAEGPDSANSELEPYEALASYEVLASHEALESYEAPLSYEAPVYYESAVSYQPSAVEEAEQPPVDAVAAAKLPQYDPDDPETFWAEPQPAWEPATETSEIATEPAELLTAAAGATAVVGDSLWDEPPADALSRLSVKVETAEQLLALPREERIDMTAFLEPSELTATFRATKDPELKKAVIDTLEHIGSPASLTALGYCFDDPDGDVQRYALEAADRLLGVA